MTALVLSLALALATPAAHAETGEAEDTADTGEDKTDGSCTGGNGGVNTGLIVLVTLGFSGIATRGRRRRD